MIVEPFAGICCIVLCSLLQFYRLHSIQFSNSDITFPKYLNFLDLQPLHYNITGTNCSHMLCALISNIYEQIKSESSSLATAVRAISENTCTVSGHTPYERFATQLIDGSEQQTFCVMCKGTRIEPIFKIRKNYAQKTPKFCYIHLKFG